MNLNDYTSEFAKGFFARDEYWRELEAAGYLDRPWGMMLLVVSTIFGIMPTLMIGIIVYFASDKINPAVLPYIPFMAIGGITGAVLGIRSTIKGFKAYHQKIDAINEQWRNRLVEKEI